MKIRVDHVQFDNVKKDLYNESIELLKEIENQQAYLEELKSIWQGEEADIYYIKIGDYFNKLKTIPLTYQSMSTFLERANIRYDEIDEELSNQIQMAGR